MPISSLARESAVDDRVVLGFSAFTPEQIDDAVERLSTVFAGLCGGTPRGPSRHEAAWSPWPATRR